MSDLDKMSAAELRAALSEYQKSQEPDTPSAPQHPLPPAWDAATLTPGQAEAISDAWISGIMARPVNTWTPAERDAILTATSRTLNDLNG